jgi:hypothetical protein
MENRDLFWWFFVFSGEVEKIFLLFSIFLNKLKVKNLFLCSLAQLSVSSSSSSSSECLSGSVDFFAMSFARSIDLFDTGISILLRM